ncbi:MAG: type II toxin-antitoxin system HipA family toxin [Gammaproteobacteria bacterium]|nr:type II toxin-antitoxin system HipA family toxin [Gammaproteobacteria bacterium]
MNRLDVAIVWPDGTRSPVGSVYWTDPDAQRGGAIQSEFHYAPAYLADPRAFALDPVALPLRPGAHTVRRPAEGVPAILEDSAPDDWGRRLIARHHHLPGRLCRVPVFLRLVGGSVLGALRYSDAGSPLIETETAAATTIPGLLLEADQFVRGGDGNLMQLFRAGASAGGARPKVLVRDAGGRERIAKFPRYDDAVSVVRLEAAALHVARAAGLPVPDFTVHETVNGPVLLLDRFDVTPPGGRRHMATMKTLLAADGYYHASYADMADVVRRLSADISTDLTSLYRRMVLNAALGNTDDHLKNFAMLHDERGWTLSPVYDLIPDVQDRREHVLAFGNGSSAPPTRAALLQIAPAFGLSGAAANDALAAVGKAIMQWPTACERFGVLPTETEGFARDIAARVAHCGLIPRAGRPDAQPKP